MAAISSGRPSRPFGCAAASASSPPFLAISPDAIFEGMNPGAMLLQRMCRGPSSTARLRVRWIAAAVLIGFGLIMDWYRGEGEGKTNRRRRKGESKEKGRKRKKE